jgi:hypothetical protein
MSRRHPKASRTFHRWLPPTLVALAAVMFIMLPGFAVAGAGTGGDTDDDAQMIADAKRVERAIVDACNEKAWDELPSGLRRGERHGLRSRAREEARRQGRER